MQNTVKLARDGHLGYSNLCFDSLFVSYIPFPLVITQSLSEPLGAIHIAPEAFNVSSAEFADELAFWQGVRGLSDLASVSNWHRVTQYFTNVPSLRVICSGHNHFDVASSAVLECYSSMVSILGLQSTRTRRSRAVISRMLRDRTRMSSGVFKLFLPCSRF